MADGSMGWPGVVGLALILGAICFIAWLEHRD